MRNWLLTLALLGFVSPAIAQTTQGEATPGTTPQGGSQLAQAQPPGSTPSNGWMGGPQGGGPQGNMSMMPGMGGPPPMMRMMHAMMERHMGGRFRFKRGDEEIDIRCPADQPLQACVTAATQLMDKLASMPHGGEQSGQSGTPSTH